MKKIPTLFERGDNFGVVPRVKDECVWVIHCMAEGSLKVTEKADGTNVRLTVRGGEIVRVEKRRNPSKKQKQKWGDADPWYVDAHESVDKWICKAAYTTDTSRWPDGEHCCEALGPKIQGNPLGLLEHGCYPFDLHPAVFDLPRMENVFLGLREFMDETESLLNPGHPIEGLVFHGPNGGRAKLKRKDYR